MATMIELVAALECLPQHFGAPAPSAHAALRAVEAADLLRTLMLSFAPADGPRAWDTTCERCAAVDALL